MWLYFRSHSVQLMMLRGLLYWILMQAKANVTKWKIQLQKSYKMTFYGAFIILTYFKKTKNKTVKLRRSFFKTTLFIRSLKCIVIVNYWIFPWIISYLLSTKACRVTVILYWRVEPEVQALNCSVKIAFDKFNTIDCIDGINFETNFI